MSRRFLLISNHAGSAWTSILNSALAPLGDLDVIQCKNVPDKTPDPKYDLVIIDATGLDKVTELVEFLHEDKPAIPIVVATASPTWDIARDVFLAGASDYVHKSVDEAALRKACIEALSRVAS